LEVATRALLRIFDEWRWLPLQELELDRPEISLSQWLESQVVPVLALQVALTVRVTMSRAVPEKAAYFPLAFYLPAPRGSRPPTGRRDRPL
jgi:hypothetical protein